jgi:hypothetical protein
MDRVASARAPLLDADADEYTHQHANEHTNDHPHAHEYTHDHADAE